MQRLLILCLGALLWLAFMACGVHHSEVPAKLDGLNDNVKHKEGRTPLMEAAQKGDLKVVQTLLAQGADINARDKYHWNALEIAASANHLPVVQALLAHGADVNARNGSGWTTLMRVAGGCNLSIVQALLAKGVDINARTNDDYTALMVAASSGNAAVVKALLAQGADINAKTNNLLGSRTALIFAADNGHLEVVKALLAKGADINAKDFYGNTALMAAAKNGHLAVVQALLAQGADMTGALDAAKYATKYAGKYTAKFHNLQQVVQALQATDQLSPSGSEAFNQGMLAVKQQDWQTAIRHLLKAQGEAPAASEILFNLGLAESKVPGRELRAIAWFRAYLAKAQNAANANAVRKEIAGLETRVQATIKKLINQTRQLVAQEDQSPYFGYISTYADIAAAEARMGDIVGAKQTAYNSKDNFTVHEALSKIAAIQYHAGDVAGSEKTIRELVKREEYPNFNLFCACGYIGFLKAIEGDFSEAEKTIERARTAKHKMQPYFWIATEGALAGKRDQALSLVAKAIDISIQSEKHYLDDPESIQAFLGDIEAAKKTQARYRKKGDLYYDRDWIEKLAKKNREYKLKFIGDAKLLMLKPEKEKPSKYLEWTLLLQEKLSDELFTDQQSAISKIAAKADRYAILREMIQAIEEITIRLDELKNIDH